VGNNPGRIPKAGIQYFDPIGAHYLYRTRKGCRCKRTQDGHLTVTVIFDYVDDLLFTIRRTEYPRPKGAILLCAHQTSTQPLGCLIERQSVQQSSLDPEAESVQGCRLQGQPEQKGGSDNQNYPDYDRHFDLIEGSFGKQIRDGSGQCYHDLQQFGQQKIEQYQRQQDEQTAIREVFKNSTIFFTGRTPFICIMLF